jgi:hypothetical protein
MSDMVDEHMAVDVVGQLIGHYATSSIQAENVESVGLFTDLLGDFSDLR